MLSHNKSFVFFILIFYSIISFQNCSKYQTISSSNDAASISTSVPSPIITFSRPPTYFNTSSVNLSFQIDLADGDVLLSALCSVGNSNPMDCSLGTMTFNGLPDGNYILVLSGRASLSGRFEASQPLQIDATAPLINVSSVPSSISGSTSANFVFMAIDNLSGLQGTECSLDAATFTTCVSPLSFSNLTPGSHRLQIRARDIAGNVTSPFEHQWTINTAAPTVTISSAPASFVVSTSASITFSGSGIISYECQLDSAAWTSCRSPISFSNLQANISHSFRVRGTNSAQITSAVASVQWTIDTEGPSTPNIVSTIPPITNFRSATLSFTSSDTLSGINRFECSSGSGAYSPCSSPRNLSNLQDGVQSFSVRAVDNTNNVSSISQYSWIVDGTNPLATFSQLPDVSTTANSATFVFSTSDGQNGSGVRAIECSLDTSVFAACASPMNMNNLSLGGHSFRVRVTDNANNQTTIIHNWTIIVVNNSDNTIIPSLVATRIRGPAPLAVLFNASGSRDTDTTTVNTFKDLTYSFDAGDNNTSIYSTTGGLKRRHSGGPLFAYVYETPRNTPYIAKVRVQNSRGVWSDAQVEITVEDPNQYYSGANTICVGSNSTPVAGQGGCPMGASVSVTLPDPSNYSRRRVLLRRGGVYGSVAPISSTIDAQVGAFGAGNNPVVSGISLGNVPNGAPGIFPSRVVIMDLVINGPFYGPASGEDLLLLRNLQPSRGIYGEFDMGNTVTDYWRNNPPSGWSSTSITDPRRIFYVENTINGAGPFGAFVDSALLGNTIHADSPAQHSLRIWSAVRLYLGHNLLGRVGDPIRHSLKLHSAGLMDCGSLNPNTISSFGCATQKVVISNNIFGDAMNTNPWPVALKPENDITTQGMEDIITENNTFISNSSTQVDLVVVGRRQTSRGNSRSGGSAIVYGTLGTSAGNCSNLPLPGSWCGPYFMNAPATTPNWPM